MRYCIFKHVPVFVEYDKCNSVCGKSFNLIVYRLVNFFWMWFESECLMNISQYWMFRLIWLDLFSSFMSCWNLYLYFWNIGAVLFIFGWEDIQDPERIGREAPETNAGEECVYRWGNGSCWWNSQWPDQRSCFSGYKFSNCLCFCATWDFDLNISSRAILDFYFEI